MLINYREKILNSDKFKKIQKKLFISNEIYFKILGQKIPFMNESGKKVGIVHQLQNDGKTVPTVKTGEEVACSVQNITIGRQISEEDIFYSLPTPDEAKKLLKNYMHKLNPEESKIFNKILEIQRKINPVYGY